MNRTEQQENTINLIVPPQKQAVVLADGGHFCGLLDAQNRFSQGILYDSRGKVVYEGTFNQDGLYEGQGTLYEGGNKIYEGDFVEGLYEGRGTLYEGGKVVYTGPFSKGLFSGERGVLYHENGEAIARGSFLNGKLHGPKCEQYDPKTGRLIYKGSMQEGLREGEGVSYDASSEVESEGIFHKGGLREGKGVINNEAGTIVYRGPVLDGLPNGDGSTYGENGRLLQKGKFVNGKLNGDNCEEYDPEASCLIYKGPMKAGVRDGEGTEYKVIEGNHREFGVVYENGKLQRVTFLYPDKSEFVGKFDEDKIEGELNYSNGNKFEGDFHKNLKPKKGIKHYYAIGSRFEGEFDEEGNAIDGTIHYPDSSKFSGKFKENKRYDGILYDKENYPIFDGRFNEEEDFEKGTYYSFKQEGNRKYIQAENFQRGVKPVKYFYLKDLKNNFKKFIEDALNQQSWSKKLKYIAEWSQITEIPVSAWKDRIPNVYIFLDKKISSFLESTFSYYKRKNIDLKENFSNQQFLHLVSQIGCPVFQRASVAWVPEDTFIIKSDAVDHSSILNSFLFSERGNLSSLSLFRDENFKNENLKKLFYQIQEQAYKKLTEIIVKDIKELKLLDSYEIHQRKIESLAIFDIGINKMVRKLDNAGKKKLEEILLEIQAIYQKLNLINLRASLEDFKTFIEAQCQELERSQQKILKKIFGSQNKLISCYKQAVQNLSGSIEELAAKNQFIIDLQGKIQKQYVLDQKKTLEKLKFQQQNIYQLSLSNKLLNNNFLGMLDLFLEIYQNFVKADQRRLAVEVEEERLTPELDKIKNSYDEIKNGYDLNFRDIAEILQTGLLIKENLIEPLQRVSHDLNQVFERYKNYSHPESLKLIQSAVMDLIKERQEPREEEKVYPPSGSRDSICRIKINLNPYLYHRTNKSFSNSRISPLKENYLSLIETSDQLDNDGEEFHNPQHRTLEYPPPGGATSLS